jgi:hypothetical protein
VDGLMTDELLAPGVAQAQPPSQLRVVERCQI